MFFLRSCWKFSIFITTLSHAIICREMQTRNFNFLRNLSKYFFWSITVQKMFFIKIKQLCRKIVKNMFNFWLSIIFNLYSDMLQFAEKTKQEISILSIIFSCVFSANHYVKIVQFNNFLATFSKIHSIFLRHFYHALIRRKKQTRCLTTIKIEKKKKKFTPLSSCIRIIMHRILKITDQHLREMKSRCSEAQQIKSTATTMFFYRNHR